MITNIEGLLECIKKELKEFTDIAVIGLSGGADSTLVALLCKEALGKSNVYGVHMPATEIDLNTFNKDSMKFSKYIGINDIIIPLAGTSNLLQQEIRLNLWKGAPNHLMKDMTKGNLRARIRMNVLYAITEELSTTCKKRVRVIGTDNFSENFLGYFTKYGDGGVDINPIGELFKSEVYQLLDYFKEQGKIEECHINRTPSAGLWEGQTDEKEMGFSYDEIEECIKNYYDSYALIPIKTLDTDCYKFVMDMHIKNCHKLRLPDTIRVSEFCSWGV